jgi:hypothetical protein
MGRYCRIALMLLVAASFIAGIASAQTKTVDEQKFKTYVELMKKDLRTQKQSMVDQAMGLEAGQKSQFWTIYEGYQTALNTIWDQRVANIKKYADNFDKMTDAVADELAVKMLDIEAQRTALKKKYYAAFKEKMGPKVAARFLQAESTIGAFMDVQLGSELPIIQ